VDIRSIHVPPVSRGILRDIPLVAQNLCAIGFPAYHNSYSVTCSDLTVLSCAVARPARTSPSCDLSPRRRNPCPYHMRVHFFCHPSLTQGHR
jgi:hypothetical protein